MGAHLITVGATVVSMKPGRAIAGSSWLAVSSVSGWTPRFAMGAAACARQRQAPLGLAPREGPGGAPAGSYRASGGAKRLANIIY